MFSDSDKRKAINKITHPEIYAEIRRQVLKYFLKGKAIVKCARKFTILDDIEKIIFFT